MILLRFRQKFAGVLSHGKRRKSTQKAHVRYNVSTPLNAAHGTEPSGALCAALPTRVPIKIRYLFLQKHRREHHSIPPPSKEGETELHAGRNRKSL